MSKKVVKWSIKEEEQLLKEVEEGLSDADIAKKHERSEGAIAVRRKKVALDMFKDGKTLEQIQKSTGVSEDEINEQKKHQDKKNQGDTKKLSVIKKKLQEIIDLL